MKKYIPLAFVLFVSPPPSVSNRLPERHWLQYRTPEDAGFSSQKLQKAHKLADQNNSANVLIIYKRGGGDMPKRGSHQPGVHWYYNNWNYNALNTVFEQQTHEKLTDAFVNFILTLLKYILPS